MAAVVPFRRRPKKRGKTSNEQSDDRSSVRSAWLSLANKLQILALEEAPVVFALERIVDGALEELGKFS